MSEDSAAPLPVKSDLQRVSGQTLAKIWLLLLIVGMTYIAVQYLTAILIQNKIAQVKFGSQQLSIWRAKEIYPTWEGWKRDLAAAAERVRQAGGEAAMANRDLTVQQSGLHAAEVRFQLGLSQALGSLTEAERKREELPPDFQTGDRLDTLVAKIDRINDQRRIDKQRLIGEDLSRLLEIITLTRPEVGNLAAGAKAKDEALKAAQAQWDGTLKNFSRLFRHDGGEIPTEDAEGIVRTLTDLSWIAEFSQPGAEGSAIALKIFSYKAISFDPPELVTLGLVLSMGVIGSTLFLLSQLLDSHNNLSLIGYLFRPFFGAITALAAFILANTGLPLVADTVRAAGATTVNPYFVSFIAIVSGLMTERALIAIQSAGASVLSDASNLKKNRFARKSAFAETEVQQVKDDLRLVIARRQADLGDKDRFEQFLAGKVAVAPDIQDIVGAYLHRWPRDLFFDEAEPEN